MLALSGRNALGALLFGVSISVSNGGKEPSSKEYPGLEPAGTYFLHCSLPTHGRYRNYLF